jgi:hypothetical protein
MDLQSLDISNNKIGSVIKSIGQNIFKQQLETPCKTTIQNIADEALALSKQHVAEKLTQSENLISSQMEPAEKGEQSLILVLI